MKSYVKQKIMFFEMFCKEILHLAEYLSYLSFTPWRSAEEPNNANTLKNDCLCKAAVFAALYKAKNVRFVISNSCFRKCKWLNFKSPNWVTYFLSTSKSFSATLLKKKKKAQWPNILCCSAMTVRGFFKNNFKNALRKKTREESITTMRRCTVTTSVSGLTVGTVVPRMQKWMRSQDQFFIFPRSVFSSL